LSKAVKRLGEWFRGYDDAPLWLCFCRLIFALSALSFIVSFFGPLILGGDLIGFLMYQWSVTHAGLYIIVIVVTFTLALISGIPTFLYEKKKMKLRKNEAEK
jgi:phosphotransferase system  glucose/maltose/N-acetylglucosamine-specific IIC component